MAVQVEGVEYLKGLTLWKPKGGKDYEEIKDMLDLSRWEVPELVAIKVVAGPTAATRQTL